MDYEKKYQEALSWIKELYPTFEGSMKEDAEHYFPELAKSEDERIMGVFRDFAENYLFWEKSGLTKEKTLTWLKKQDEQKPTDTEKGAKGNDREIPNSAWSEEDKAMVEDIIEVIDTQYAVTDYNEMVNWLKSLKDRVQPKVELTQLDKNILEAAIAFVEQNNHFNCWRGVDKHTVLSALHSLKPQNTWKPSEEQMKALTFACIKNVGIDKSSIKALYELKEQLKKLMEE